MNNKKILLNLRNQINDIDSIILKQLSKRKKIAIKIAKKKIMYNIYIQDKNREAEIINKLTSMGKKNNLSSKYIKIIFNKIIKNSIFTQYNIIRKIIKKFYFNNLKFAYLGPKGSYSEIATNKFLKIYCKNYNTTEYYNFKEIFNVVKNKKFYGIVPFENSDTGLIKPIYNLLCKEKLNIIGKFKLFINHYLLSKNHLNLNSIHTIYSHPETITQCSNFIQTLKNVKIKYTNSTSEAMKIISESDNNNIAAIGDQINAKLYGLKIISQKVSNQINNNTKFIILTNDIINLPNITPTETILILNTKKILLFEVISILTEYNIYILEIQSIIKVNSEIKEIIYLKVKNHIQSIEMKNILKIFQQLNIFIHMLSCYPTFNLH